MDKKLRRSANLEQMFRVREQPCGSGDRPTSMAAVTRMGLRQSPGGTGCGLACQFIGVSPELAHRRYNIRR